MELAVFAPLAVFGMRFEGFPDFAETAGVLCAVIANQQGHIRQPGGEKTTDVGDAGARIEHDVTEAFFFPQVLEQGTQHFEANFGVDRKKVAPVDLLVKVGGVSLMAMCREQVEIALLFAGQKAFGELGEVALCRLVEFALLLPVV